MVLGLHQPLTSRAQAVEEMRRQIIEEERQRLLQEHASKLIGFMPKACSISCCSI